MSERSPRRFRVLQVSDFYPPFIGGAERQVQLLSRELRRRGHEVSVATVWHAGLQEREMDDGVAVHRIRGLLTSIPFFYGSRRRYHPPFPEPVFALRLRSLIRELSPDIVHAHGWVAYSAAVATIGTGIPLLVSARDYGYTCALRTMLWRGTVCSGPAPAKCVACAADRYGAAKSIAAVGAVYAFRPLLRRRIAALHSISTFVQSTLQRDLLGQHERAPGDRPVIPDIVIPSFLVDPTTRGPAEALALPAEPFILFVGALEPHKGIDDLLNAYETLRRRRPMPALVVIGTVWPDSPTAYPDGVSLFTDVPHDQVMDAWGRCLFGVAPARWPEPLGGVVSEAMSRGRAVIATRVGGHTDVIEDGRTGILVAPHDAVALATAIERLVDDAALRDRLGGEARIAAERLTAAAVVPQFERLYERMLGQTTGPRAQP